MKHLQVVFQVGFLVLLNLIVGCGGSGASVAPTFSETSAIVGESGGTVAVGEVILTFPPKPGRSNETVLGRWYSSQLAESPVNLNLGHTIQFSCSKNFLESEDSCTIEVSVPRRATGDFLVAQSNKAGDLYFHNFDQTHNGSALFLHLNRENILDLTSESGNVGDTLEITLSVAERVAQSATSRAPFTEKLLELSGEGFTTFESPKSISGKRVAVIVHGLNNRASSMLDTHDQIVLKLYELLDARQYDQILFYEYFDSTEGISSNGHRLSERLTSVGGLEATQIDFHGHSMGGLVSRWAIEREAIGVSTTRLFTYGTPHLGAPIGVLRALAWRSTVSEGLYDLRDDSEFMELLNGSQSPHRSRIPYFVIAGTNENYSVTFIPGLPLNVGALTTWQYAREGRKRHGDENYYFPHDGIVSIRSSLPPNLAQFGLISAGSTGHLDKNHTDVASGSDVLNKLKQMLIASGSGVIR